MNDTLTLHFNRFYWLGFFIGLIYMVLYAHHQVMTGDQFQMIYKGYLGAYNGQWLQYGNAASAVGNVPGPLSALIVGVPILIWDSPYSPMLFLLLLHVASFFLLDSVIKQVYSNKIRLVFLVLYWLNPWFLFESLLYNPSYLFFFSALHLYTAFHLRTNASLSYTFLHVLSIGMAMQMHYSWVVLAVISSYLFYRNIIKINWAGVLLAFLLVIYSLIPYFQELLLNEHLRVNEGNKSGDHYIGWGAVNGYPIIKAMLYWLRYASFFFNSFMISSVKFNWLTDNHAMQNALVYGYKAIIYGVGLFTVWFSFKSSQYSWRKIKPVIKRTAITHDINKEQWLLLFCFGTFIAIIISAALSPIVFNYWHLIITFPFALMPLLAYINSKSKSKKFTFYLLVTTVYLLIVNSVAIMDSRKYSFHADYKIQTMNYLKENNLVKKDD